MALRRKQGETVAEYKAREQAAHEKAQATKAVKDQQFTIQYVSTYQGYTARIKPPAYLTDYRLSIEEESTPAHAVARRHWGSYNPTVTSYSERDEVTLTPERVKQLAERKCAEYQGWFDAAGEDGQARADALKRVEADATRILRFRMRAQELRSAVRSADNAQDAAEKTIRLFGMTSLAIFDPPYELKVWCEESKAVAKQALTRHMLGATPDMGLHETDSDCAVPGTPVGMELAPEVPPFSDVLTEVPA